MTSINSLTVVNHATSCTCGRSNSGGAKAAFFLTPIVQRLLIRNVGAGPLLFAMDDALADLFTVDTGEYSDLDVMEMADLFVKNTSGVAVPIRLVLA